MIFILVWRNLWRNRRRTLITMASVLFAVVLSTLLMSLKEGVYSGLIDSVVGTYTGFGQVHAKNYQQEKSLDDSFEMTPELSHKINTIRGIKNSLERVEGIVMAASENVTKVALVTGVDVKKEAEINKLHERVVAGEYLQPGDKAVMLGAGLAEYLKINVNDTVVLLGQGYHGTSAAGKYHVKALVKFGSPELSKQLIFLPLQEAQWFYGMEGLITSLVLNFDNPDDSKQVIENLRDKLGNNYEVMGWEEIMPELNNMIETDRVEGYVFMFILYMVVSFGIFGTILMMLAERRKEFGMLVSVGMKRLQLASVVWMEVILISLAGAIIGMAVEYPISYYFHLNPVSLGKELTEMTEEYGMEAVIRSSVEPSVFIQQGIVIFLITCLISIYPFVKLMRLDAIKYMRS